MLNILVILFFNLNTYLHIKIYMQRSDLLIEENLISNEHFIIKNHNDLYNIKSIIIDNENIQKIKNLIITCGGTQIFNINFEFLLSYCKYENNILYVDKLLLENEKLIALNELKYYMTSIVMTSNGDNFNYKIIFIYKEKKLNENYIVINGNDNHILYNYNMKMNDNINHVIINNKIRHIINTYHTKKCEGIINCIIEYKYTKGIYLIGNKINSIKIKLNNKIHNYQLIEKNVINSYLSDKYIYYIPINNYTYGSNIIDYDINYEQEINILLFEFDNVYTGNITLLSMDIFKIFDGIGIFDKIGSIISINVNCCKNCYKNYCNNTLILIDDYCCKICYENLNKFLISNENNNKKRKICIF